MDRWMDGWMDDKLLLTDDARFRGVRGREGGNENERFGRDLDDDDWARRAGRSLAREGSHSQNSGKPHCVRVSDKSREILQQILLQ